MEIRYLLTLIRAHWRFLAVTSLVAFVAGLSFTYVLSEKFEASTKILIRPRKDVKLAPGDKAMMDYPLSFTIPAQSMSATYSEIMTSEAVASRVVDLLRLHELTQKPDPRFYVRAFYYLRDLAKIAIKYSWDFLRYGRVEHRDPYLRAVDDVVDGLSAKPVPETYLFELTAVWDNPDFAALIADTAAEVFVSYNRDASRSEDGTSAAFLAERGEELRVDLESARKRLEEYSLGGQTPQLAHQLTIKLDDLAELELARESAVKERLEVEAELGTLQRQLDEQDPDIHSGTVMTRNPVVARLEEELAGYEVDLAGMKETYQAAHPQMKALQAKIAEAKRAIASEQEQVRLQDSSAYNPVYDELARKVLDRSARRDLLVSREQSLVTSIQRFRDEIDRLTAQEGELARLRMDVSLLEEQYHSVFQEHGEARLAAAQELSEIRVLHRAVPPLYPTGPIKVYYAGGAMLMGFLAALTLLLLRDYTHPPLVTAADVEQLLGAPVIVTVPRMALSGRATALLGSGVASTGYASELMREGRSGMDADDV